MNFSISSVVLLAIAVLVEAVPIFGVEQTTTSADKGMLFPEFSLRKGTNDWMGLVLKQKALGARLPGEASKDEQSLVISPGILPIEELREIFLEKCLPQDVSVFEKKRRWMYRLSGLKLEDHGGADALIARFEAETMTIQVVYTVSGILFYIKSQTPFIPPARFATDKDIKALLATFLRQDLCVQFDAAAANVNQWNLETTDGQKITFVDIPKMKPTPLLGKDRSIAAAEELLPQFIVSCQYVSFGFGKARTRKWEGAQPQGFSQIPLFVEASAGSNSLFEKEQEVAEKALERKTTNSLNGVVLSLDKVLQQAPAKPEDVEKEMINNPDKYTARRSIVRTLYQAIFTALQQVGGFQADDRVAIIEKALDAQSGHPSARIFQSELRRSILRATKSISPEKAASIAKRMIASETHSGRLREELGILFHGIPEAEYVQYVQENIKVLSTTTRDDQKDLFNVWVQCMPPKQKETSGAPMRIEDKTESPLPENKGGSKPLPSQDTH